MRAHRALELLLTRFGRVELTHYPHDDVRDDAIRVVHGDVPYEAHAQTPRAMQKLDPIGFAEMHAGAIEAAMNNLLAVAPVPTPAPIRAMPASAPTVPAPAKPVSGVVAGSLPSGKVAEELAS